MVRDVSSVKRQSTNKVYSLLSMRDRLSMSYILLYGLINTAECRGLHEFEPSTNCAPSHTPILQSCYAYCPITVK